MLRVCNALAPTTHPYLAEEKSNKGTLRPAKSMDSLSAAAGTSDGECRCVFLYMKACVWCEQQRGQPCSIISKHC